MRATYFSISAAPAANDQDERNLARSDLLVARLHHRRCKAVHYPHLKKQLSAKAVAAKIGDLASEASRQQWMISTTESKPPTNANLAT